MQKDPLFDGVEPYEPNFYASNIAAGETEIFELTGRRGQPYGVTRLLPGGTPSALAAVACTLELGDDDRKLFSGVRLSAVRQLFLRKGLAAPFEISPKESLTITLDNTSASAVGAGLMLKGLPGRALKRWKEREAGQGRYGREVAFLYASDDVGAGSVADINVPGKSRPVDIHRMTFDADAEDEVIVSIDVLNAYIKQDVTKRQITDEYQNPERLMPHHIGADQDLTISADNTLAAQSAHVSFLADCYYR